MDSIIDALIVTLGLDASAFKKGQREAKDSTKRFTAETEENAKKVAGQAKAMADGFRHVRNELLGLFAVSIGANGLKDFIAGSVGNQAQLGYLAKNLDLSARELDAWGKTVKTVGGTAEGFQGSLQNIASGIEAFKLGEDSTVVAGFRAIGINLADSTGKVRSFKDILLDSADAIQRFTAQDQIRWAQMVGIDQPTLNLLRQGRKAVSDLYSDMYMASGVTDESVRRAQEAQRVWGEFTGQMSGTGQAIFEAFTPALVELTGLLKEFGVWVNAHRTEISGFFTSLVEGGGNLAKELAELDTATDGWSTKLIAASAAIGAVAGGVKLLSSALRGLLGIITAPAKISGWVLSALGATGSAILGGIGAMAYSGELNAGEDEIVRERKKAEDMASGQISGGDDMASRMLEFFMQKGWSRAQAAGIVANLSAESGFDHEAVGDSGQAYGIAQWHTDRQAEFKKRFGHNIRQSSLEEQAEFVHFELTEGKEKAAGNMLRAAKSAFEAGAIVSEKYERPRDRQQQANARGAVAARLGAIPSELGIGAAANREISTSNTQTVSNQSEVHIGQLNVQTQATDADGVARGMQEAISQNGLINASAMGVN